MTRPTPDPKIPPLMSVTEASAELGVTRQAILKGAASGRIPGCLVGKTWVFRAAVIRTLKEVKMEAQAASSTEA